MAAPGAVEREQPLTRSLPARRGSLPREKEIERDGCCQRTPQPTASLLGGPYVVNCPYYARVDGLRNDFPGKPARSGGFSSGGISTV